MSQDDDMEKLAKRLCIIVYSFALFEIRLQKKNQSFPILKMKTNISSTKKRNILMGCLPNNL